MPSFSVILECKIRQILLGTLFDGTPNYPQITVTPSCHLSKRKMPPSKRKAPAGTSSAVVPHSPPRNEINLDELEMAEPRTEKKARKNRTSIQGFCHLANVRQDEAGNRLDSMYGTLCVFMPDTSPDLRNKMNAICKFGDADYDKPPNSEAPSKNFLADNNLLCAGKFFTEARWVRNKEYMASLPEHAPGCMQWNVLKVERAQQICSILNPLMSGIGECTECPS